MELKERILAAAAMAPSSTRRSSRRRQILFMTAAAAAMAAGYWAFAAWIFGWQEISRSNLLLGGTVIGAALVAALGRTMLGRPRRWLLLVTVVAPLALLGWKLGWSALFGNLDESPRLGYRCLLMSVTMGAVPLVLLALTRRGEDPRHPGLLGAAIGVGVGACGWVLVDLWCPVGGPIHLLRGHVLPVIVLGILGAVAGRLLIAVRDK
jgi:hypothetical protein